MVLSQERFIPSLSEVADSVAYALRAVRLSTSASQQIRVFSRKIVGDEERSQSRNILLRQNLVLFSRADSFLNKHCISKRSEFGCSENGRNRHRAAHQIPLIYFRIRSNLLAIMLV